VGDPTDEALKQSKFGKMEVPIKKKMKKKKDFEKKKDIFFCFAMIDSVRQLQQIGFGNFKKIIKIVKKSS
jgi:hypothetical protein